ncbi:methyltransferase domain-containing protein [Paracoccaceae bacterium]|nr:methyltransferase domain-containing protein [Paracoccaceae bacterium]
MTENKVRTKMTSVLEHITLFESLRENHIPSLRVSTKTASSSFALARFSRFINKYLYKLGLGSALNRYDNSLTIYSAAADKKLYKDYSGDEVFCNFGSGAFFHKKWKNYDYPGQSEYYKTIQGKQGVDFTGIDLCKDDLLLPYGDNEVTLIYCSHTLEHLEADLAQKFLLECKRVLRDGGAMRVALPHTTNDFKMNAIINSQKNIPTDVKNNYCGQAASHILADTAAVLNDLEVKSLMLESNFSAPSFVSEAIKRGVSNKFLSSNPERHISFWDYETLSTISQDVGFKYCIPFYRGSSLAKPFLNLNVFDTTEPHISFYAEFIK